MLRLRFTLPALLLSATLAGAIARTGALPAQGPNQAPPPTSGLDLAGMDRSVQPGDSFWQYANGTWLKEAEIPADRSYWGPGEVLTELTDRRTADLIQEIAKSAAAAGTDQRKIRDYYASFLDTAAIDARRPRAAQAGARLHRRHRRPHGAGALPRHDAPGRRGRLQRHQLLHRATCWASGSRRTWTIPTHYSPFLVQGGLGMPDRSYYLDSSPRDGGDARAVPGRTWPRCSSWPGCRMPDAKAAAIVELETRMAQAHVSREANGDVRRATITGPAPTSPPRRPGSTGTRTSRAAGLGKAPRFVVWQPSAVTGLSALVASEPLDTWKAWLAFHAIQIARGGAARRRSASSRSRSSGRRCRGAKKQRDRWKRAVDATNDALGYAVGRLYVARYFPPAEKARARPWSPTSSPRSGDRIDRLEWMAPATKQEAKAKLAVLKVGVGYPDKWRDYAGLEIVRGDAFGNARARRAVRSTSADLAKLGKPVDRGEWVMTPQTVNAVNLPAMNAMNFPAAILQPPYFDPDAPAAMDYGAIGAIIGHEISHSFDNSGRAVRRPAAGCATGGRPRTSSTSRRRRQQLVAQYDAYRPFPDLAREREADAGREHRRPGGPHGGVRRLSPLARRQAGAGGAGVHRRPAVLHQLRAELAGQDPRAGAPQPHPDRRPRARRSTARSTVRNIDAWYPAFGVKPGEALYLAPADRVRIW